MSKFLPPSANRSGVFVETGLSVDRVQVLTDHDASVVVPSSANGAVIHAQMQMTYPVKDDFVRAITARILANGTQISELGTADGNNQGGAALIHGACVGVLTAPGTYAMSVRMDVSGRSVTHGEGEFDYNHFMSGDAQFSGQLPLIATRTLTANNYTSDALGDPDNTGARMYVSFRHYIVQLY